MPYALCPMPYALCPISSVHRTVTEKGYIQFLHTIIADSTFQVAIAT